MPGASDPAEAPGAAEEGERPKERAALAPKLLVRNTALTEAGQMDAFVMRLPPTTDRAQARVSSKRARGEPAGGIVAALGNLGGPPPAGDAEGLPRTVRKRARARKECNLSSVKALLAKVEREAHEGLTELMREHAFVGCASEMAPLLQQGTKLFLVDLPPLTREAAYQACLRRFGDLDRIALDPPAPVRRLVRAVLDAPESGWAEGDGDKDEIAAFVARLLLEDKAEMLDAYFGLRFARDAGTLEAVPELIDNYLPDRALLPMFLLRLAVQVDWSNEERCFQGVASELAEWYMVRPGRPWADMLPAELRAHAQHSAAEEWGAEKVARAADEGKGVLGSEGVSPAAAEAAASSAHGMAQEGSDGPLACSRAPPADEGDGGEGGAGAGAAGGAEVAGGGGGGGGQAAGSAGTEWRWCCQHVLFPAMRFAVQPPRALSNDGTVVQLVCTSQLYRVFERC